MTVSATDESSYETAIDSAFKKVLRSRQEIPVPAQGKGASATELDTIDSLLKRSYALRHESPRKMMRLANQAVELALSLDPATYGARRVADQQARAWGELANAYRVSDELWEAERAFGEAFRLLERGTGDRRLRVRLHALHASFLGAQRRFPLALAALDLVFDLYQELSDVHLAGESLLTKAVYLHYSGRSEEAITLNQRGLGLIDEERDPGLRTLAAHNHLQFLVACDRFSEAQELLYNDPHCARSEGRLMTLRRRWLEGQIDEGLGNLPAAEAAFLEVKEEFEASGLGFIAALASLELALVRLRQGRIEEAKEGVIEAVGVFAALEIHREILGAVQLLKEAFRLEKASVELMAKTVAFLRDYWQIHSEPRIGSVSN
jgi:tetratricopeptide (TPR) repeat protein